MPLDGQPVGQWSEKPLCPAWAVWCDPAFVEAWDHANLIQRDAVRAGDILSADAYRAGEQLLTARTRAQARWRQWRDKVDSTKRSKRGDGPEE